MVAAKLRCHIIFWIRNLILVALIFLVFVWIVYSERLGGSALRAALTGAGVCVVGDFGQPRPAAPSEFRTLLIAEAGSFLCFGALLIVTVFLEPVDSRSDKGGAPT